MVANLSDVTIIKLSETETCSSSQIHNSLFIDASYSGIFGNVLINVFIFLICITLFAILRDKTEICGILPLDRNDTKKRREQQIDENDDRRKIIEIEDVEGQEINQNIEQFEEVSLDNGNNVRPNETFVERLSFHCRSVCSSLRRFFQGYWGWIKAIFQVSDEDIHRICGQDAIFYLSFQRYLIGFCMLLTVICMLIVFPVNFLGNSEKDYTYFGFATINNLDPNSSLIWVHVLLSIALFPIGILLMRKYSRKLQFEKYPKVSKTLMVVDIPEEHCNKNLLVRQIQEAYPDAVIEGLEFAYNYRKLISIDKQRRKAKDALFYLEESRKRPVIYQYAFCQTSSCCCCCQKRDAVEFYTNRARTLTVALDEEELKLKEKPLRTAFITFETPDMAFRIYQDNLGKCGFCKDPQKGKPNFGRMSNAPICEDIYWENLACRTPPLIGLAVLVNFILFAFFFLWTTPLNILNSRIVSDFVNSVNKECPMVGSFFSTLLMWNFVSRMPIFVNLFEHFVFQWTRSRENNVMLFKTLWIQLFMLIILPTLEFNNMWAFLVWLFTGDDKSTHLHCIYLANSFGFYLNYVITSALVGSVLDLIRPSQLMRNIFQLSATTSEAERYAVRQTFQSYFHFGVQYAWFLPVFAVTVIYSISCPILAPFGLLYMCMQHGVDRHNLVFVHKASKITKNVHAAAINFVVTAILLSQLSLSFFIYLQRGSAAITIFSFVVFGLTALIFAGQFFLNSFQWSSPIITFFNVDDKLKADQIPAQPDNNILEYSKYLPRALFRQRGTNPEPYWLNAETAGDNAPNQHPTSNSNEKEVLRNQETESVSQDQPRNVERVRSYRQGYESLGQVFTIQM